MSKHTSFTKGPWQVAPYDTKEFIDAEYGHKVDLIEIIGEYPYACAYAWTEPNAQLIAAAPELLEALKDLVRTLGPYDARYEQAKAWAAIAKAEGRE